MTNILIERRKKLFNQLSDNSLCLLHSNYDVFRSADENYPFTVNNNFYYLTNVLQADVKLIIAKVNNNYREILFIEPIDELLAKWVGKTLTKEEASNLSGVDKTNIYYNFEFTDMLTSFFQIGRYNSTLVETVYLDLEKRKLPLFTSFAFEQAKFIHKEYPNVLIKNVYNIIIEMRMVKTDAEISLIKESIDTTNKAILNVMRHAKKLQTESEAEAYYDFELTKVNKDCAFTSIIASGLNASVLHYVANNASIEKDSLMLMDVGAKTKLYNSDISRTFPTSGKFTDEQKAIYEIVLDCNKKCIEYAKPGMSWLELNTYAKKLLATGCLKLGLINSEEEISKYYFHSIGHSLGLDTHDPSIYQIGLLEDMVITIEPGLYIPEKHIGIRIEDDIQLKSTKNIVLSKQIIKEVADLEEFMK